MATQGPAPGSLLLLDTSLCFPPPLCCQILFSLITPGHRAQPIHRLPQEAQTHRTFHFVVLLKNGREEEECLERVRSCSICLFFCSPSPPPSFPFPEQMTAAQAPSVSLNCIDWWRITFVCLGCYNKIPWTGWLINNIPFSVL